MLPILIVIAYLLGSVPFGLLIARSRNIDLRQVGSGNIGATNVARALGKKWAYLCFVLDCLKGLVPMVLAGFFVDRDNLTAVVLFTWLAVGCAAVLGHIFSLYLRFTGGKGAATGLGVMLGLYPYYTLPGLVTFAVWLVLVLATRYVSLASIAAAALFPISLAVAIAVFELWTFAALWPLIVAATVMAMLIIARHAENIKRLLEGSESKIFQD